MRKMEGVNIRGYAVISLGWKNTSSQSQRQLDIVRLVKSTKKRHIQCENRAIFVYIVIQLEKYIKGKHVSMTIMMIIFLLCRGDNHIGTKCKKKE